MENSKENLDETPFQTAGPFLHIGCMPNAIKINRIYQNDLGEIPFMNKKDADLITIEGSVFDGNGVALDDVMIETWQCDDHGVFRKHKGFTRVITNFNTGDFNIKTVKPGYFKNKIGTKYTPHIIFWIVARGMNRPLITKMYFHLKELKKEEIFQELKDKDRISTLLPKRHDGNNYEFNIHIQGKKETIFFEI